MKHHHSVKRTVTLRDEHQKLPPRSLKSHGNSELGVPQFIEFVRFHLSTVELKDRKSIPLTEKTIKFCSRCEGDEQLKKVYFITCSDPG